MGKVEVEVEDMLWATALPSVEDWVNRAAQASLDAVHARTSGGEDVELAVLLVDDEAICDLNARFRGKATATNVLSFPAAPSAAPHIGDIALAFGVCAREAAAQSKPLRDHLIHLVVHGVLHLVGYDHEADADAAAMEEMERDVLMGFGIPDPYALRETDVEF